MTRARDTANIIDLPDAKGDLFTATAADTPARLAIGNDGESLVADSSTSTGLRYQTGYNGNAVINGGMDIFQRSSTPTTGISTPGTNAVFALDRWQIYRNTTGATMSRQVTGDTTNLPQIQYCGRTQRTVSTTSTAAIYNSYTFETTDSIRFAGQTVTFSFYARAGANYSAASSGLVYALRYGTGTDQNNLDGFTGSTNVVSSTSTLTTTWQRFQGTATVSSTATQLGILFTFTPVGTAGANDYFEITGVQVELGSIATTFKRSNGAGGTLQGELAACYRYFQKFGGTQVNESFPYTGFSYSTTQGEGPLTHKGTMRTTPSLAFSTLKISDVATYNLAVTNLTLTTSGSGPDASYLVFTVASGTSSGKINYMRTDASTAGYIYLSAEL